MSFAVRHRVPILAFAVAVGVLAPLRAQDAAPKDDPPDFWASAWDHVLHGERLLGEFGGARKELEAEGLAFDAFYNGFLGSNLRGGVDTGTRYSDSFDLFVRGDTQKAGWWDGGSALLLAKSNRGRNINDLVGALSEPVDDADFDEPIYIDQLWYQQALLGGALRIRAGYLDQQAALDRNRYANSEDLQFWSTFLDNNPIVPLKIGFGATVFVDPTDWMTVLVGTADADNEIRDAGVGTAFDGVDSLMGYFELQLKSTLGGQSGALEGNYRFGAFWDPRERPELGSGTATADGSAGAYVGFDQMLLRESEKDLQGLGVFARWGYRDRDVFAMSLFWSVGAQYEGPIPGRDRDVLGAAVYDARPSARYQDDVDPAFVGEIGAEVYYRLQMTPWFAMTPDFQYIRHPGGLSSAEDAVVVGLRGRVSF